MRDGVPEPVSCPGDHKLQLTQVKPGKLCVILCSRHSKLIVELTAIILQLPHMYVIILRMQMTRKHLSILQFVM